MNALLKVVENASTQIETEGWHASRKEQALARPVAVQLRALAKELRVLEDQRAEAQNEVELALMKQLHEVKGEEFNTAAEKARISTRFAMRYTKPEMTTNIGYLQDIADAHANFCGADLNSALESIHEKWGYA